MSTATHMTDTQIEARIREDKAQATPLAHLGRLMAAADLAGDDDLLADLGTEADLDHPGWQPQFNEHGTLTGIVVPA